MRAHELLFACKSSFPTWALAERVHLNNRRQGLKLVWLEGDGGNVSSKCRSAAVLSGNLQRAAFSVHEWQRDAGDTCRLEEKVMEARSKWAWQRTEENRCKKWCKLKMKAINSANAERQMGVCYRDACWYVCLFKQSHCLCSRGWFLLKVTDFLFFLLYEGHMKLVFKMF